MIRNAEPLSMPESLKYINKEEDERDLIGFIKKFIELKTKDAETLKKNLEELDLMKMKAEHISRIIDLLPEDATDLNKIFVDVSLDEDETKKILDKTKEFR